MDCSGADLPGLAPTILVFAIVNPLGWFLTSLGLVRRGLNMALTIAPFMIVAYLIGLRSGPLWRCCCLLHGHALMGLASRCLGRSRHRRINA